MPSNYSIVEDAIHHAVQINTLIANNAMTPLPDDSQTTTYFDISRNALIGKEFRWDAFNLHAEIQLDAWNLGLLNPQGEMVTAFFFGGQSFGDLVSWLKDFLQIRKLRDIHYQLSEGFLHKKYKFPDLPQDALKEWSSNRQQANRVFEGLNQITGNSSGIRIWPHNFDTGVYYDLAQDKGETLRSAAAGFAIPDGLVDEPYYYLSVSDSRNSIDYSNLPELPSGKWLLTNNWKGAVLGISEINNDEEIMQFFKAAWNKFSI